MLAGFPRRHEQHTHGSVAAVPVVRGVFVLRDSATLPSDFVELRR
jgi:hypothetical protein